MAAAVQVILANEAARALHRRHYFRDRTNVFEIYDDEALIRDYRFPKKTIMEIIDLCQDLASKRKMVSVVPLHIRVLSALR